ncbi:MAG: hypothetical protein ABI220_01015 [Candidatus Saccharimonadales bacterium]
MDQNPQQQLTDRLTQANNILVTVSNDPSVDQLAACIGLTLILNHMGKHATAVFSGTVPSTIDFLKPEKTLKVNTDSLRDFIIALDKSKADKLRYKVEDKVVKIFITPYRTSISEEDLDFSQGDFNVDVVVALGVHEQAQLDQAITSHGRILHDATVASINLIENGNLGSINWTDSSASSLSELVVRLTDTLDKTALDDQVSTALLTGIVAATERFSNDKTSPKTMSISAELMAAGANQQLIANELSAPAELPPKPEPPMVDKAEDKASAPALMPMPVTTPVPEKEVGTLEINHPGESQGKDNEPKLVEQAAQPVPPKPPMPAYVPEDQGTGNRQPQIHVDAEGRLHNLEDGSKAPEIAGVHGGSLGGDQSSSGAPIEPDKDHERQRLADSPSSAGQFDANSEGEGSDPSSEELTLPSVNDMPILSHDKPSSGQAEGLKYNDLASPAKIAPNETLDEIEEAVHAHGDQSTDSPQVDDVGQARDKVDEIFRNTPNPKLEPVEAVGSQPLGEDLHSNPNIPAGPANPGFSEDVPGSKNSPADQTMTMPMPPPSSFTLPAQPDQSNSNQSNDPGDRIPPVAPPFIPQ